MWRDQAYLSDILIAARRILSYWETIHHDLPKLIEQIHPMIPPEDQV